MPSATFTAASICSDALLARIDADIALRPTVRPVYVFLGDYIDRGPSSRETIDRLIELGKTRESIFLKGNHELIAIKCLSDRGLFDQWLRLGGREPPWFPYGVRVEGQTSGKQIAELQSAFHSALPQALFSLFSSFEKFVRVRRFLLCSCRSET